jgi:divinyl chlorophyllide a 8-vinyl-reductase
VRPTAFFKSLDGQIESVRKGNPALFFGRGDCAANAICETDLANYLIEASLSPAEIGLLNSARDVGGPDVPPITKRDQIELIYETLNVPKEKRVAVSLPLEIFDVLIPFFASLDRLFASFGLSSWQRRFEDAAEIARIVRYYASEPMVRHTSFTYPHTLHLLHFLPLLRRWR